MSKYGLGTSTTYEVLEGGYDVADVVYVKGLKRARTKHGLGVGHSQIKVLGVLDYASITRADNSAPRLREVTILETSPAAVLARNDGSVEAIFREECERWIRETRHESSVLARIVHPAYMRIIGLGPQAVPLIIHELRRERDHWFVALAAIVGEDVAAGAQTVKEAATRWSDWGTSIGIVD